MRKLINSAQTKIPTHRYTDIITICTALHKVIDFLDVSEGERKKPRSKFPQQFAIFNGFFFSECYPFISVRLIAEYGFSLVLFRFIYTKVCGGTVSVREKQQELRWTMD